jgi:tRNA 5-methylaminomethyl-2-thiouridine biosynthesis bifunctional protein
VSTPHWNGSRLHHPGFNDHYGIDDGGFGEALHVFVDAVHLAERFAAGGTFAVGDLGLGSGRNLLVVWSVFAAVAPESARLVLHTFERDPLPWADARAALQHCWDRSPDDVKRRLDCLLARMEALEASWPTAIPGVSELATHDPRVRIVAWVGDARQAVPLLPDRLDHWCLDGFSPSSNPSMWQDELLKAISARTIQGGTASTYTSAGAVRRSLAGAGFAVEKVPGFGRKRDMVVARAESERPPLPHPALRHPWPEPRPLGRVAVVGAGIAGSSLARELAEAGVLVDVFEAEHPGAGASGNPWGLLQPLPNLGGSPVGDWTSRAFAWTRAWAARRGLPWHALSVARYGGRADYADRLREELGWGSVLEAPDTIQDAPSGAILGLTAAAMVPPRVWCEQLLDHPGIHLHTNSSIARLSPGWKLDHHGPFDTVVLANSVAARDLVPALDLHPVRGQLLTLPATEASRRQVRALCGPVYLLPQHNGQHILGATYDRDDPTPNLRATDSAWLWGQLEAAIPGAAAELSPPDAHTPGRVSWRGVTPGRLPFVGPIDDPDAVARLLDPRKRTRPQFPPDALQPGLWVSAGHGSRGLVGAPLAAKVLVDAMMGRIPPIPSATLDAVHPSRVTIARVRR